MDENSAVSGQPPAAGVELAAQPQGTAVPTPLDSSHRSSAKRRTNCRFFASQKGCRAGDACPYVHDVSGLERKRVSSAAQTLGIQANGVNDTQDPAQSVASDIRNLSINDPHAMSEGSARSSSQVVSRPVSKTETSNPREFQINQLRRRFRPTETINDSEITLSFGLAPSDPDFPFEMDKLQCILHVPLSYPANGRPTIEVINPEMGRDFQANVERGFDDIVDSTVRSGMRGTLLNWMNSLDRQLERLLTTTERGPTLKFIANVGNKEAPESQRPTQIQKPLTETLVQAHKPAQEPLPLPRTPSRVYTAEEKAQAERRRAVETKQIEARLGRLPLFHRSHDGLSFIIPVQPTKVDRLPIPLRSIKTVKLLVPSLYPLEASSVKLQGVDSVEAEPVEVGFSEWIGENSHLNLMSQINYMTSNMHNLAKTPVTKALDTMQAPVPTNLNVSEELPPSEMVDSVAESEDKPHIRVIPRPPEWTVGEGDGDSDDTDDLTPEEDFIDEDEDDEDGGAPVPSLPEPTAERGVALSFPYLELYGIELLELVGLNITVRCERCKEHMDVKNIPQVKNQSEVLSPKVETCKKCANPMSLGFRQQLMHANTTRAGYLDLDGCTIVDLLPSSFIPTCSECSTAFPGPVVAVRGESAMANCRECHRKMVFKIPEVKFLLVGSAAFTSRGLPPKRKKPRDLLGIVAGQELPRRGRCSHYGKSYRWFRFSCCAKIFPCDKCHDAATDHPNGHANRMICGFCSREQVYRPENCGICRAVLVGKAGSGFWEGGKGTRNKTLMSRKDPRKYKRLGATTPRGAGSSKK